MDDLPRIQCRWITPYTSRQQFRTWAVQHICARFGLLCDGVRRSAQGGLGPETSNDESRPDASPSCNVIPGLSSEWVCVLKALPAICTWAVRHICVRFGFLCDGVVRRSLGTRIL